MRAAARSSPRSSLVKDAKERGIMIEIFNDLRRKHLVDYGIGQASRRAAYRSLLLSMHLTDEKKTQINVSYDVFRESTGSPRDWKELCDWARTLKDAE